MAKKRSDQPQIEPKVFQSVDEIDRGIAKLERRIKELEALDVHAAVTRDTGADNVVVSNIRIAISEIFGTNSPEFNEHKYIELWAGPMYANMGMQQIIEGTERGKVQTLGTLRGLVDRLKEKREDFATTIATPSTYFDDLKLHPRIAEVSRDLFMDAHPWEAVFAASKTLINYVRERSGRHDLDGVTLMRTVFSKNAPVLAFNDLSDQTDQDEQEGMMHLFEGAVLCIRNPGGHSFPEGPEQRAIEYISLLSLLAYRVQEAKLVKTEKT